MTIQKLLIGSIGTFRVEIPILKVGSGSPQGLITAVQHGGEWSPLWIIRKLLASPPATGTMTIIPIANPFGFIFGQRNEAIEGKNPNRQFPGRGDGDFSARLADAIFNIAKTQNFVIDLHTFSRQAPFLVGFAQSETADHLGVEKIIQLLAPDVVWTVNEKKGEDQRFAGSLDGALSRVGVPSVFIEMPNYQMISNELMVRILTAIKKVFEGFQSPLVESKLLKTFSAKYLYADEAGLFEPSVKPLENVAAGQTIGTVSLFPTFEEKNVNTPIGGTVLTIRGKDVIRTGTKVASIGV